jgi:L-ascorbate metabolism protein UlaG (beta-lactamase superfamily)
MRIQFAANASFLIDLASGVRVLTDPWYHGGIYYGSWHNFPPLSDRQRQHFLGSRPHYVYISHLHPDHLDAATLALFPLSTPILIGKMPHPHLSRAIRRLGFTDVRELPLGEPVRIGSADFCIFPQFEGTGDGTPDDVGYALDTSLMIRDGNGEMLLNVVDNPIKPRDAEAIRQRFGAPDVAILPYSGASFFPHAFPAVTDSEKTRKKDALRQARLNALIEVDRALQSKWVIPAAGSYVMGGRIARYSSHLHQATPGQLVAHWAAHAREPERLKLLAPGDALVLPEARVERDAERTYADFTEESRLQYAMSLADRELPQDAIRIPADFVLPWRRMLEKSRRNLWFSQQRLKLFPPVDVELRLRSVVDCPDQDAVASVFRFALDRELPYPEGEASTQAAGRAFVRFSLDSSLLLMVLIGGAIWNNVEIGALVECERRPDTYTPTVHSLMSFFCL